MSEIKLGSIEEAINIIDNLSDDGLEKTSEEYINKQPDLFAYLMTAVEDYGNENLTGYIIYYFCLILSAVEKEGLLLNQIEVNDIEKQEDEFTKMLDLYFDTEDQEILESYTEQSVLVQFILIEISTEDDDGSFLDEDTATQLFIVLISMISLINKSIIHEFKN